MTKRSVLYCHPDTHKAIHIEKRRRGYKDIDEFLRHILDLLSVDKQSSPEAHGDPVNPART